MRTKTLAVVAALGVAGVATSMAQVYSANAVGYITVDLKPGFNLVVNQLDNMKGNKLVDIMGTGLPELSIVYTYAPGAGFKTASWEFGEWGPAPLDDLPPGKSFFVFIPLASPLQKLTFVGEVMQGDVLEHNLAQGFNFVASIVPIGGKIQTDLKYTPAELDTVYKYANPGGYSTTSFEFAEWTGGEPVLAVGEGAVILSANAKKWTRSFKIN